MGADHAAGSGAHDKVQLLPQVAPGVLQAHLELHARGQVDADHAAGGGAHDIARQLPQVQLLQQAAQSGHQLRTEAARASATQPSRGSHDTFSLRRLECYWLLDADLWALWC